MGGTSSLVMLRLCRSRGTTGETMSVRWTSQPGSPGFAITACSIQNQRPSQCFNLRFRVDYLLSLCDDKYCHDVYRCNRGQDLHRLRGFKGTLQVAESLDGTLHTSSRREPLHFSRLGWRRR